MTWRDATVARPKLRVYPPGYGSPSGEPYIELYNSSSTQSGDAMPTEADLSQLAGHFAKGKWNITLDFDTGSTGDWKDVCLFINQ